VNETGNKPQAATDRCSAHGTPQLLRSGGPKSVAGVLCGRDRKPLGADAIAERVVRALLTGRSAMFEPRARSSQAPICCRGQRGRATVEAKLGQFCRMVEDIGAANISAPRSSRTAMKFPGLAKLGRSVPMRCAMNDACFFASFLDEHSCPMKSRAGMSPTKSKKNRFITAQPKWWRSVPKSRHWHAFKCREANRSSANLLSVPQRELPG
jgi:hypothetical protein